MFTLKIFPLPLLIFAWELLQLKKDNTSFYKKQKMFNWHLKESKDPTRINYVHQLE